MTDTTPAAAVPAPGTVRLAVIPGDGIGPEVTAEALKVLEAAAPAGVKFEQTRYDLGAERYLATGEVLPDSVLERDPRPRRDPARRGRRQARRPEPAARASSSAACCCGCASSSTTTSTCARRGSSPERRLARWPTPARSTSWSSARAPRAPTPATAARCASARPTRSRPRSRSTPRSASSGSSATPSRAPSGGPRQKLTLVHKTNVLVNAGAVWWRLVQRGGRGVPRGHRGLHAHRRGDDLHDHRPGAAST